MRRTFTGALLLPCLLALAGCQNRQIVDDNPVLGPPPPRTTLDSPINSEAAGNATIQLAAHEEPGRASLLTGMDSQLVARIGGQPVFAADVLRPFRPVIETRRLLMERLPDETRSMALKQLDAEANQLLHRALPDFIDREIVLQSIQRSLKQEQIDGIQDQIDDLFSKQVDTIIGAAGLASQGELEGLLTKPNDPRFEKLVLAWREGMGTNPGTSLSESRDSFGKMAMAAEFLRVKAKEPKNIDRQELLNYYRDHAAEYDVPLEVEWQQLVVSKAEYAEESAAVNAMQNSLRRLRNGEDFAVVAKEVSSGPSASEGGMRGWIEKGSLVDSELEDALFQLQIGEFSEVFERDDRYEVVRLTRRRGGFRKPFAKVQSEIRKSLLAKSQKSAREEALEQMRDQIDVVVLLKDPSAS